MRRTITLARRLGEILRESHATHADAVAEFQNEFLIAEQDGLPIVTTPDLITLLDADTGVPITTETIRFGLRVIAVAIPCAPQGRARAGLALVGPQYFRYKVDYCPFKAYSSTKSRRGSP